MSTTQKIRVAHASYGLGLRGWATPDANEFGEYLVEWDNGYSDFYSDADILHEGNVDPNHTHASKFLAALNA